MLLFIFLLKSKRKTNQKENFLTFRYRCTGQAFAALLQTQTVHWLETLGFLLEPSNSAETQFELLTQYFASHAKILSALEIFTVALAIKNKIY